MSQAPAEKRHIQRIVTTQAGHGAFWLVLGGVRVKLRDLSLEGFAVPAEIEFDVGDDFPFRLAHDGDVEVVSGRAQVVNRLALEDDQVGCRILSLDGQSKARLHDWLARHVRECATVPLSAEDAAAIVSGPSIV